jgi:hypothetical protein
LLRWLPLSLLAFPPVVAACGHTPGRPGADAAGDGGAGGLDGTGRGGTGGTGALPPRDGGVIVAGDAGSGDGPVPPPDARTDDSSSPDGPRPADAGPLLATVSIDVDHAGAAVPADFVGLSIEWSQVLTFLGDGQGGANPATVQLLRNFEADGHRVHLRIGGNSTDRTWLAQPGQTAPVGASVAITPEFFSTFKAVHAATGASFIIGLNLGLDDPALASAELQAELAALPAEMVQAYEIGNEPNAYRGGKRPAGYSFADYQQEVDRFLATLSPLVMDRPRFALPAIQGGFWLGNLSSFVAAERSHLAVVTVHKYPFFVCKPTEIPPTAPDLLTDRATTSFAQPYRQAIQDAFAAGAIFRMDEANSVACGGVAGVSDVFAAALWGADVMFELADLGASGINFHVAGKYAPFLMRNGVATVQGLYYGLLFFSRATASDGKRLPVQVTSGARVRAWATRGSDGAVRVAVLNEELTASGAISIEIGAAHRRGDLFRLSAPTLTAPRGIRFGGIGFDGASDGKPIGTAGGEALVGDATGRYTLTLPAASGALLVVDR